MAKYAAYGTLLKKAGTTVAQVVSVSGIDLNVDTIDVTTHDSANATREFVMGLIDAGEITFEIVYDPDNATHTALRTDLAARTSATYTLTFTDTSPAIATFTAYVTRFAITAAADGALMANATLKVSGLPTWA